MIPSAAGDGAGESFLHAPSARRALAGLGLSGLLAALLGAILPAWGYHLRFEFDAIGYYFLSVTIGVLLSLEIGRRLFRTHGVAFVLILASSLACGALILLAFSPPPFPAIWRLGGLVLVGIAMGLLNSAIFQAISTIYQHDPAATLNLGGIVFGLGCLLITLLVAGTFNAYSVTVILILIAIAPALFAILYAKTAFPAIVTQPQLSIKQALADFRSRGAVLLALLLFFQFGNEWSIAGWLTIFLIHRLGVSPQASLEMLALYWLALLLGRIGALVRPAARLSCPRPDRQRGRRAVRLHPSAFDREQVRRDHRAAAGRRRLRDDLSAGGGEDRSPLHLLSSGSVQRNLLDRHGGGDAASLASGLRGRRLGSGRRDGAAAGRHPHGLHPDLADMARIEDQRLNLGRALSLALCLAGALAAADLPAKIRKVLDAAPAIERGFLGLKIVDLKTGKVLFEDHADRLFVPASNSKLFATALALVRLGPDYRFHTTVIAAREPDAEGRLEGPLSLIGGGDPNLSGRELPYRVDSPPGDGLQAIEDLAAQVVARGVKRIDGDIVGDDTAYAWEPYPPGWALDDAVWEYGAPVSALTINDNAFTLKILPGDPARISIDPPLDFYQIDNLLRPGPERKIKIDRDPGSRQLRISGTLPLKSPEQSEILAIHDPALYAAAALRDALTRRGVDVRGEAVARHALPGEPAAPLIGVELARRDSGPLLEDLRVTAKVSQNLHAELMLRAVGRARRGSGSLEAGLAEMQDFLKEIGVAPGGVSGERRLRPLPLEPGDSGRGRQAAAIHVSLAAS